MGEAETRRAIEAAHAAMPCWVALTAKERATILRRLHDLMMTHQEELARLLTREQGKSLAEARGEIAYAASFRSEEHTSELQSLMRTSYAVLGLKKKNTHPAKQTK